MTINYNGRKYEFRKCDTNGKTYNEIQNKADKQGYLQYEPGRVWLVIPGVGYGWEV